MQKLNAKGKAVLLIGDSHLPYEHIDYLDFCQFVSEYFGCKLHVHMGDYEDHHAISFHESDSELFSAGDELEEVIRRTQFWYETFPKMKIIDSNHGSLVFRRAKKHGIPLHHFKTLQEVYKTPKWSWFDTIMLSTKQGEVYLCHGKSSIYNKLAREIGCSAAQGHFHGKLEVTWANSVLIERFNMFVGCGVDRVSLAFAYGKNHIPNPMLGCGVIDEEGNPHVVRMRLNKRGRWLGVL